VPSAIAPRWPVACPGRLGEGRCKFGRQLQAERLDLQWASWRGCEQQRGEASLSRSVVCAAVESSWVRERLGGQCHACEPSTCSPQARWTALQSPCPGGRRPVRQSSWGSAAAGCIRQGGIVCHGAVDFASLCQDGDDEAVESELGEVACSDPEAGVEGESDSELEDLGGESLGMEQSVNLRQELRVQTENGPDSQWSTWKQKYLDMAAAWSTAATRDRATVKGLSLLLFRTQLGGGFRRPANRQV
jgi:hypothetical protein